MPVSRRFVQSVLSAALALVPLAPAGAQQERSRPGFPDAPGKEVVLTKCFQCHTPGMWSDLRQDRRAWEATLYRMVGRGALWSEDEIKTMAGYLGATYGREPASTTSKQQREEKP
jgi:mono/diheme cytochrome c family protein